MIGFILLAGLAMSYGWGMRGLLIGGEKGAVLPGALVGLVLAKCSGIPVLADNCALFSAIGAMGTAFGGFEPYAESSDFLCSRDPKKRDLKKGGIGIGLKGANWFGISGTFLGIGFTAMTGNVYRWYEFVIFFLLEPFIQALGVRIFNKPYDRDKKIFPKLYFSEESREEWGGNSLMLVILLCWAAAHRDWFAVGFGIVGIVAGAIGWIIAYKMDEYTSYPLKNGKYIFGSLQPKGYIDNWKIMEFSFGCVGGLAFSAYFCAQYSHIQNLAFQMENKGIWNPLGEYSDLAAWIAFALVFVTAIQYVFVFRAQKQGKEVDMHIFEVLERPLFFAVPFALVMLGGKTMAELYCFPVIMWLAVEKNLFDRLENIPEKKIIKPVTAVLFAVILVLTVVLHGVFPMWAKILMYTIFYIASDFVYLLFNPHAKERGGALKYYRSLITVYGCYFVQTAVLFLTLCR